MEKKLGRGLGALLSNDIVDGDIRAQTSNDDGYGSYESNNQESDTISVVNIDRIIPNPQQPRKDFDQYKIEELAESIKHYGIIQPIVVKKYGSNYSIIAGERRWRAAKLAKLQSVPIRIINCKDKNVLPISLIENIQRSDLNPIEEAHALNEIMQIGKYTQDQVAKLVGKSRVYVSNTMRLLNLPDSVIQLVKDGKLSAGHAKALVGVECAQELADAAVAEQWSVRQIEESVKAVKNSELSRQMNNTGIEDDNNTLNKECDIFQEGDSDIEDITNRISAALNAKTTLRFLKQGAVMTINIKNYDQMNNIVSKLIGIRE